MKYLAKHKYEQIMDNTTIQPEDFGGWSAINTGDVAATVNGVLLDPAGSVVGIDFTNLAPDIIWGDDITIKFDANSTGTTKRITLTRIKYTEINKNGKDGL